MIELRDTGYETFKLYPDGKDEPVEKELDTFAVYDAVINIAATDSPEPVKARIAVYLGGLFGVERVSHRLADHFFNVLTAHVEQLKKKDQCSRSADIPSSTDSPRGPTGQNGSAPD